MESKLWGEGFLFNPHDKKICWKEAQMESRMKNERLQVNPWQIFCVD